MMGRAVGCQQPPLCGLAHRNPILWQPHPPGERGVGVEQKVHGMYSAKSLNGRNGPFTVYPNR
jgi:hypothetical protein